MRITFSLLLLLWLAPSFACSFDLPTVVAFDKALARPRDRPPDVPKVRVQSIKRGSANEPLDSCWDIGAVVLAIPATEESQELVYSFKRVSGTADKVFFQTGPIEGYKIGGALMFYFRWPDGESTKQEPIDLVVRVTPFRRSGLVGKSVNIRVTDGVR